jgi:hypothetical protein
LAVSGPACGIAVIRSAVVLAGEPLFGSSFSATRGALAGWLARFAFPGLRTSHTVISSITTAAAASKRQSSSHAVRDSGFGSSARTIAASRALQREQMEKWRS